jgi:hypothetical protein
VAGHNVSDDADRVGCTAQMMRDSARVRRRGTARLVRHGRGPQTDVEPGQVLPVSAKD